MNPNLVSLTLSFLPIRALLNYPTHHALVKKELHQGNPLEVALELFPSDNLDWDKLSRSEYLTPALLARYRDKLNWTAVSGNDCVSSFSLEVIDRFVDDWNWYSLSSKVKLTEELLEKHSDKLEMSEISVNLSLTPELIERYQEELDWDVLVKSPVLTFDLLLKYRHHLTSQQTCTNPNLTREYIISHFTSWSRGERCSISSNPALTADLIEQYAEKLFWESVAYNPNLTPELMEEYSDRLDWDILSDNHKLTEEFICRYPHELNWRALSCNPCLTPHLVRKYEYRLDKENLLLNPVVVHFLEESVDSPLVCWETVSWTVLKYHPHFFLDHLDWPWCFDKEPHINIHAVAILALFDTVQQSIYMEVEDDEEEEYWDEGSDNEEEEEEQDDQGYY